MRSGLAGAVLAGLLMLATGPVTGADLSPEAHEKAEVRAIFRLLVAEIGRGDGWTYDLPCVYDETWDEGYPPTKVKPLLTVREALDPENQRPDEICDFAERNKTARQMAKKLAGQDRPFITTANTSFTYPVFNASLTRATVDTQGGNDQWTPDGPGDFVGSGHKIYLAKKHGRWTIRRIVNEWTAN